MYVNGEPQMQLVLQEGINRHVFGEGLAPLEQEWLAGVINDHIGVCVCVWWATGRSSGQWRLNGQRTWGCAGAGVNACWNCAANQLHVPLPLAHR